MLYQADGGTGAFVEVVRTEVIKNSLNPQFATKFQINYKFEEKQVGYIWDVFGIQSLTPVLRSISQCRLFGPLASCLARSRPARLTPVLCAASCSSSPCTTGT